MNRFNIFNQVHKALRSLLYETAIAIQQTDFLNKNETSATLEQLTEVLELFEKHADTEDNLLLPALAQYEPSVVNVFEEEHDKDHALARRLTELAFVYRQSVAASAREEAGRAISVSFTAFMAFNLEHMAKEEKVLNKLLWRYYSDDQLHGITRQILDQLSPGDNARYSRWMMRGLNNAEITGWLREVKDNAPDFIYNGLLASARNELSESRWAEINEQLTTKEAVVVY